MAEQSVGKWLLNEDGLVKGFLTLTDDSVTEVCEGEAPAGSRNYLIMPGFVNTHTHIGDSLAYPAPKGTVDEIVGPPDGYKHRALRSGSREQKVSAMASTASFMARTGTTSFSDFREEGVEGISELRDSLGEDSPSAVVLGRPTSADDSREEIEELLRRCEGFGMSAMRDWPKDFLSSLARISHSAGKMFAIHASEAVREDIDEIIELKPDFVVHMTKAHEADIAECADAGIPIVVCPRSNEFFGLVPDIHAMLERGVLVGLGTDNSMIARPDMLEELKAAYRIGNQRGALAPLDVVNLATYHGRKILNAHGNIATGIRERDDLVVIEVPGDDPLQELVTRARSEDIKAIVRRGKVWWRSESWTR